MCGRYVLEFDHDVYLGGEPLGADIHNFNVAPTTTVPILLERFTEESSVPTREIYPARWGLLPGWAKDASFSARTFNARSETLFENPASATPLSTDTAPSPSAATTNGKPNNSPPANKQKPLLHPPIRRSAHLLRRTLRMVENHRRRSKQTRLTLRQARKPMGTLLLHHHHGRPRRIRHSRTSQSRTPRRNPTSTEPTPQPPTRPPTLRRHQHR